MSIDAPGKNPWKYPDVYAISGVAKPGKNKQRGTFSRCHMNVGDKSRRAHLSTHRIYLMQAMELVFALL